jgi:hypothetical protein
MLDSVNAVSTDSSDKSSAVHNGPDSTLLQPFSREQGSCGLVGMFLGGEDAAEMAREREMPLQSVVVEVR